MRTLELTVNDFCWLCITYVLFIYIVYIVYMFYGLWPMEYFIFKEGSETGLSYHLRSSPYQLRYLYNYAYSKED